MHLLGVSFWLLFSALVHSYETDRGKEFMVGFPSLAGPNSSAGWNELLLSSLERDATVQITGPGVSQTIVLGGGNTSRLRVPGTVRMTRNTIENISYIITSDEDIGVVAAEIGPQAETYLALPKNSLPQEYIIPAYTVPSMDYSSQIAAIAFEDDTNVTFIPKSPGQKYNHSKTLSVLLARGQSYQYSRQGVDLSGTIVKSDKHVSILSAVDCAEVPIKFQRCGLILEQIPPVATWGYQFIMNTRFAWRRISSVFRVIASKDGTNVTVPRQTNSLTKRLDRGDVWEIDLGERYENVYQYIECSDPCLVVVYNKGFSADSPRPGTSPFMIIVPSIRQFTSDQMVSTFKRGDNRDYYNYIVIVSEFVGMKRDQYYQYGWRPIPGTGFGLVHSRLYARRSRNGVHFKHWSKNGTFSAVVYGQSFQAHGYPSAMALEPSKRPGTALAEFYTPTDNKVYYIKDYNQLEYASLFNGILTFDVKGCDSASLYLARYQSDFSYGPDVMFHIKIGGGDNGFSFIAKGQDGTRGVIVNTPNVLSCEEFTSMWVSWTYEYKPRPPYDRKVTISLGLGRCVGEREIMAWTDRGNDSPSRYIVIPRYIGIGSYQTSQAWWRFHRTQNCSDSLPPPTGSTPTMDPKVTPSLPPYGEFQERCGCRFAVEMNVTAGEEEPGSTLYTLDDIIYNLTDSRSGECLGCQYVMDRCRIDCTEQALALWKPNGLYTLIEVEGGIGPRERAVGQLLCEAHLGNLEPPGRRIVVYYDPGRCGEEFHTTVFPQSLCCKEIDIPEIGFVVVWDHQCDGNVEWPADKQILYGQ